MKWFMKLGLFVVVALCFVAVTLAAQDSSTTAEMEQQVSDLMAYLVAMGFGVLSSMILGTLKKIQGFVDSAFFKLIKPVQAYVVAAFTFLLPFLCDAIGITHIDPQIFVAAPFGTVFAVGAREVLKLLKEKLGEPA